MRLRISRRVQADDHEWSDWFAWHPVRTRDGWWLWLETVKRKGRWQVVCVSGGRAWVYDYLPIVVP